MLYLSSLDNLLEDAYIIFQKSVDNFEIEHKTCLFLVRVQFPLKVFTKFQDFQSESQKYNIFKRQHIIPNVKDRSTPLIVIPNQPPLPLPHVHFFVKNRHYWFIS